MTQPAARAKIESRQARDRYAAVLKEAFRQEPFLSVSDWAAEHRFLTGAEAGKYNPDRCPYQRAIQDCFNDPDVREITWHRETTRSKQAQTDSNMHGFVHHRTDLTVQAF